MPKFFKKIQDTIKNRKTYRAGILQAKAYRIFKGYTQQKLNAYKLSTIDWALLGLLCDSEDGVRPSVLAEELGVEPPFVTVVVGKLTKMNLVSVKNLEGDNRVKIFFLTEKGKKMVNEIEIYLRNEMKVLIKAIPYEDLLSYMSVLEQVAENAKGIKIKKFPGFKD